MFCENSKSGFATSLSRGKCELRGTSVSATNVLYCLPHWRWFPKMVSQWSKHSSALLRNWSKTSQAEWNCRDERLPSDQPKAPWWGRFLRSPTLFLSRNRLPQCPACVTPTQSIELPMHICDASKSLKQFSNLRNLILRILLPATIRYCYIFLCHHYIWMVLLLQHRSSLLSL